MRRPHRNARGSRGDPGGIRRRDCRPLQEREGIEGDGSRFSREAVLRLYLGMDFVAMHRHPRGGFNPQTHDAGFDLQHHDTDIRTDGDTFITASRQDEHRSLSEFVEGARLYRRVPRNT